MNHNFQFDLISEDEESREIEEQKKHDIFMMLVHLSRIVSMELPLIAREINSLYRLAYKQGIEFGRTNKKFIIEEEIRKEIFEKLIINTSLSNKEIQQILEFPNPNDKEMVEYLKQFREGCLEVRTKVATNILKDDNSGISIEKIMDITNFTREEVIKLKKEIDEGKVKNE